MAQAREPLDSDTYPAFSKATIILPVINETYSLTETMETVTKLCSDEIEEYMIVIGQKTSDESRKICEHLKATSRIPVRILEQTRPFLGGAMQDAFEQVRGSHVVMMSSDLETDPVSVPDLIRLAKENPDAVITASRWLNGGSFVGYSKIKLVCNFAFQKLFALIYGVSLTDMTYGFRIFPTKLVQKISWQELRHPFLLETVIKPLRLGTQVFEIPTNWKARTEGESQNPFFRNFAYFKIGLKTRLMSQQSILKN